MVLASRPHGVLCAGFRLSRKSHAANLDVLRPERLLEGSVDGPEGLVDGARVPDGRVGDDKVDWEEIQRVAVPLILDVGYHALGYLGQKVGHDIDRRPNQVAGDLAAQDVLACEGQLGGLDQRPLERVEGVEGRWWFQL